MGDICAIHKCLNATVPNTGYCQDHLKSRVTNARLETATTHFTLEDRALLVAIAKTILFCPQKSSSYSDLLRRITDVEELP